MAINREIEAHLSLMGMRPFSAELAMDTFTGAVNCDPVQLGIKEVNKHRLSQYEPENSISPRFFELVQAKTANQNQYSEQSPISRLTTLAPKDRREMPSISCLRQVSKSLRLASDGIGPEEWTILL